MKNFDLPSVVISVNKYIFILFTTFSISLFSSSCQKSSNPTPAPTQQTIAKGTVSQVITSSSPNSINPVVPGGVVRSDAEKNLSTGGATTDNLKERPISKMPIPYPVGPGPGPREGPGPGDGSGGGPGGGGDGGGGGGGGALSQGDVEYTNPIIGDWSGICRAPYAGLCTLNVLVELTQSTHTLEKITLFANGFTGPGKVEQLGEGTNLGYDASLNSYTLAVRFQVTTSQGNSTAETVYIRIYMNYNPSHYVMSLGKP